MIVPMKKYSFLIYHKEFDEFLESIRKIGVLHIIEKKDELDNKIKDKIKFTQQIDSIIKFLESRNIVQENATIEKDAKYIIEDIISKQNESESLKQQLTIIHKEIRLIEPWGQFSNNLINKLKEKNIQLKFYSCSEKSFKKEWLDEYTIEIIDKIGATIYFVAIFTSNSPVDFPLEEIKLPSRTLEELTGEKEKIEKTLEEISTIFDDYAKKYIPLLKKIKLTINSETEFDTVVWNTIEEAENKIKIIEGWVPEPKEEELLQYLANKEIVYLSNKPIPDDKVPILLKNNKFSKLFEPIGKLFSLPSYQELDLTAFFAPFFMMFFGFCLGDAAYGLLFVIGATIAKFKLKKEFKPILTLIQLLGVATIIFGTLSGTFFGIDLIKERYDFLGNLNNFFLDANKMFYLSFIVGGIQVLWGMIVKAMNITRQFGFPFTISTIGWIFLLVSMTAIMLLQSNGIIADASILIYICLAISGVMILFFNDPKAKIYARVGKGIWDIYTTVTGVFGDLLSYIRLFALGISSAILGNVVNQIATQFSNIPFAGPVVFIVILLVGHIANIAISSLGSFVHPMRLTFVEFYKNAGFTGGGLEYKPFSNKR
ncbi:MAG: hypothetical protein JXA68_00815 [Ignavibacteriales bacterium]|nr:hypothetical protein [Ignavibacteriales bacterium]